MNFKHSNCIVVFNNEKDKILFCKRKKNPYKGLYHFVGGKLESEETSEAAAYRELQEETGIRAGKISGNIEVLGKSLAKRSMAIIPKIRELDEFLNAHCEYKNVICESHPELCFARLNGEVLSRRKQ